jgi:large conductance mechanosensitive channel
MGLLKEFKEFAMKGSVVDLAVGVVIGAAFGKIVSSLVNDIIMPPLGILMGGVDFSNKAIELRKAQWHFDTVKNTWVMDVPPTLLKYGVFINNIIDFLIVAAAIFFVVKLMNAAHRKPTDAAAAPTTKECAFCTSTIPIHAKKCPQCTADLPALA